MSDSKITCFFMVWNPLKIPGRKCSCTISAPLYIQLVVSCLSQGGRPLGVRFMANSYRVGRTSCRVRKQESVAFCGTGWRKRPVDLCPSTLLRPHALGSGWKNEFTERLFLWRVSGLGECPLTVLPYEALFFCHVSSIAIRQKDPDKASQLT